MLPDIWLPNARKLLVTYLFYTCRFYTIKLMQTRHFCVRKSSNQVSIKTQSRKKNKKALVSGNRGEEKSFHPGACKFIFLINFMEIFSFFAQFLLLFLVLVLFVCSFVVCFLSSQFLETRILFFGLASLNTFAHDV